MKKFIKRLLAKRRTKMPQGVTEFNTWCDDIIWTYDLPNNDSIRFALASEVLHSKPEAAYAPKEYYGFRMLKGASNEVAVAMMRDLKAKREEEIKKQQEAAQAPNDFQG